MNEVSLNMEAIRQKARQDWFKQRKQQMTIQERIEASVPNWLIIVAAALFALSAPHTAKMFDMITPGFGWAGVLAVEFGLLYIAFRRKIERKRNGIVPHFLRWFEGLLFVTSVLVNGSGALIAVVTATGVAQLSASAILESIGSMSIVAQVGLILVPLAAFIIPIGTVTAGEGLAAHSIDGKAENTELDNQWLEVEQLEVYRAAVSFLISKGVTSRDAGRRAGSAVSNLYNRPERIPDEVKPIVESGTQSASVMPSARTNLRTRERMRPKRRPTDVRAAVREHLQAHPEDIDLSSGQMATLLNVSKTIAWEEMTKWKAQNGKD